jgi:DNA-binding GntR family transcriptional regulator
MNLPFSRPLTLRDAVSRQLRDEIVSGTLPPGAVIKDAELAARLGFSITPVREALAQLAMEGLIEMPPNRAKRVAPLTKQSALELCEIMCLLSVCAFERGVSRLSADDLLAMHAAHADMLAAIARDDRWAASLAGLTFVDIVIRAAGNRELRRMLAIVVARFQRLVMLRYQDSVGKTTTEMHTHILAALARGDHATAVDAYREQLTRFQRTLEAWPAQAWD